MNGLALMETSLYFSGGPPASKNIADAVLVGNLETVKALLDSGVDPSYQNNKALILAAQYGHLEIFKLLLEDARVDPSDQNNEAIIKAAQSGHLDIFKLLLSDDRVDFSDHDDKVLIAAAEFNHVDILKWLIQDARIDPSAKNIETAIMFAAYNGYEDIFQILESNDRLKISKECLDKFRAQLVVTLQRKNALQD